MSRLGLPRPPRREGDRGETTIGIVIMIDGRTIGSVDKLAAMTELVERAREAVLRFFSASSDEYVAIFTPNATGALRLVGEAYPFQSGDRFLLTFDNHNSVNGSGDL